MPGKEIILSNENWQFRRKGTEKWHPASVPGCVHTDLHKNRLIPDPFFGLNEKELQWIEREDWEYRMEFELNEEINSFHACEIVFEGLDTYSEVWLNERSILKTNNMYIPWKKEISELLQKGKNSIFIIFSSPYNTALSEYKKLPYLLPANNDEGEKKVSPFTRKAPYMYGWDWGPRLLTSGIWKEVKLELCPSSVIKNLFLNVIELNNNEAFIDFESELELFDDADYHLIIEIENNKVQHIQLHSSGQVIAKKTIKIKNPELWWPRGFGEPYRYEILLKLQRNGETIDFRKQKFGIRKVELVRDKNENGTSFQFRINEKNIFIRGANIIPIEYFPSEITSKKYEELVFNALIVNMNMLRAWGGGIYEDDFFYELCDSHGIMVWQDFMFSCGMYPSDKGFLENVSAEIRHHAKRLKKYASVVLWCGNNEVLEGYLTWGWKEKLGKYHNEAYESYKTLFHQTIPSILNEEDGSRPYWSSSPSPGPDEPPELHSGDFHYWDLVKDIVPYPAYKENTGRFMSEYGFKSYPELRSIQSFLLSSDWDINSPAMEKHQGWKTGVDLVQKNIQWFYPEPQNFQQFLYISQLLQADAIGCAIEAHRRAKPRCMGSLYWQLNDCWPAASWASVDYYGRWKALHYRLKKYYRDTLLVANNMDGKLKIYAISDHPAEKKVRIYLRIIDFEGNFLAEDNSLQILDPDSALLAYEQDIDEFLSDTEKTYHVLIMKVFDGNHLLFNNLYYFVRPGELKLQDPEISIHLERKFSKYFLFLKTEKLAKNIHLVNNKTDGFFSENFFDLLPGEDKIVVFEPQKNINCKLEDFRYISLWNCMNVKS